MFCSPVGTWHAVDFCFVPSAVGFGVVKIPASGQAETANASAHSQVTAVSAKMVSVDTTRAEICHVGACHLVCHVARPMGQLIAAICSDTCIDDISIDPHGLACAQHVAFVAPETPRIGGFRRPLRVVF